MSEHDELLARPDICYVTENPCGTDTVMVGHGPCPGKDGRCYKAEIRDLTAKLEAERKAREDERRQWNLVIDANEQGHKAVRESLESRLATVFERTRERCAKVCEKLGEPSDEDGYMEHDTNSFIWTNKDTEWASIKLDDAAAAIRALAPEQVQK